MKLLSLRETMSAGLSRVGRTIHQSNAVCEALREAFPRPSPALTSDALAKFAGTLAARRRRILAARRRSRA